MTLVEATLTSPSPGASTVRPGAAWLQRYSRQLVLVDLVLLVLVGLLGVALRFHGSFDGTVRGLSYPVLAFLFAPLWLGCLALSRCYETRFLGSGSEEFKRIGNASLRFGAVVVTGAFLTRTSLARGYLIIVLPLGLLVLLLGRSGARLVLRRARSRGGCCHRVLVVGTAQAAAELVEQLRREPLAGLVVVGACVPGKRSEGGLAAGLNPPVPVVGGIADVPAAIRAISADTVAVVAGPGMDGEALRSLSYSLEGSGVDLLVAPRLTNVTGSRVSIRPVAGLPLLHVDEPELGGARKLVKTAFDRSLALAGLLVLSPFLLLIILAIRLTSPGSAIFRQERVGRGGATFQVWKFRSMYADAEERKADLLHRNEAEGGVLFKLRDDPRITPLGRRLRAYSLDELPQLVNVVLGHMSLVGPRPPLLSEVERYEGHTHRRLLVKPGITGLWQVSGRSDLSWDETVRLDLQYVENWSLGLDLAVLAKTVVSVLRRSGAY